MRLLVITQEVDTESKTLGFFHEWIRSLAPHYESIEVICLKEGKHTLPENVHVHSLGKEKGRVPGFVYALRFKLLAWKLRRKYDAVFVHMNQEYVLVGGLMWKFLDKPVYMWRNHYAGSWLTDIAAVFCTKVFCTSTYSYTAKYSKKVLMPVGIDVGNFHPNENSVRAPRSILFLARIAPSKHPDILIEALGMLLERNVSFTASIYGSPLPQDARYYESIQLRARQLGLKDRVRFHPGIPNTATPEIYRTHSIFVNCSRSGMFDKTIFEAAACGADVLAASEDWRQLAGHDHWFSLSASELANALERRLAADSGVDLIDIARTQSLDTLAERLVQEMG